jgi:hypothetical protein
MQVRVQYDPRKLVDARFRPARIKWRTRRVSDLRWRGDGAAFTIVALIAFFVGLACGAVR